MLVAWSIFSCLKPLAFGAAVDPPANPVRGRTPFVFRTIFEDKPRMCVAALHPEFWVAYDPATCSLERACSGVEFHGKVYDFSQQNTKARPPIWFEQPNVLVSLPGDVVPEGATAVGVIADQGFRFLEDDAELVTPPFDPTRFSNLMVYFDEKSRRAPFRVELLVDDDPTPRQWFHSTLHRDNDREWQDNAKLLSVAAGTARLRFVQVSAGDAKELRNVRVKGAYRAWSAMVDGAETVVEPDWGGYRRAGPDGTQSLTLLYALVLRTGERVLVEESPEVVSISEEGAVFDRRFVVRGLREGVRLRLSLAGTARSRGWSVDGAAVLSTDATGVVLEFAGDASLRTEWGRPR